MSRSSNILADATVEHWLNTVQELDKVVAARIRYTVMMYRLETYRLEAFRMALVDFARFRGLASLPCQKLEDWITGNIIKSIPNLGDALATQATPSSILDHKEVKIWLNYIKDVDRRFVEEFIILVRRRAAGIGKRAIPVDILIIATALVDLEPCEPIREWLQETKDENEARIPG